ncbi:hypothetical protein H6796_02530, partial [Candidatus Nomurabacteria bacterium]|nr:hypothetical protein [Candidatus Nomurabacteria bacterium]
MAAKKTTKKTKKSPSAVKKTAIAGVVALAIIGGALVITSNKNTDKNVSQMAAGTCGTKPVLSLKPIPPTPTRPSKAPVHIKKPTDKKPTPPPIPVKPTTKLTYNPTPPEWTSYYIAMREYPSKKSAYDKAYNEYKRKWFAWAHAVEKSTKTYLTKLKVYNTKTIPNHNRLVDSIKKSNSITQSRYNTAFKKWNSCVAKLRNALNKAQAAYNKQANEASQALRSLQASKDRANRQADVVSNKRSIYQSYTLAVAAANQAQAQNAHNSAVASRQAAQASLASAEQTLAKRQAAVAEAREAYYKKKNNTRKNRLDAAIAARDQAKTTVDNRIAAVQATWRPYKDTKDELDKRNSRLDLVRRMDASPTNARLLKPRTDAKYNLDVATRQLQ